MEFEMVLGKLLDGFETHKIRYALMGGFALGALGVPRATMDLDFLVHDEDIDKLHQFIISLGYERRFYTRNVSQYTNKDSRWGSIDFIHAARQISQTMLQRALEKPIFSGRHHVRALRAEDIIGLKVQAMANDPRRTAQERADIEALMNRYRRQLDWSRIEEFYRLFDMENEFRTLKDKFQNAQ